ncbi:hypothetical protein BH10PSE12_BH10PSE12_02870 [soil metagenome]
MSAGLLPAGELYRRANRIHLLSQIAMDCSASAHGRDSVRAAKLLAEIAALAGKPEPADGPIAPT